MDKRIKALIQQLKQDAKTMDVVNVQVQQQTGDVWVSIPWPVDGKTPDGCSYQTAVTGAVTFQATVTFQPHTTKANEAGEDVTVTPKKGGTPPTSPWVAYDTIDAAGKEIKATITFDASNNLTGCTIFRDPACLYQHIYLGLGGDGTPNTTTKKFTVPGGTTNATTAQLNAIGLFTLSDVLGSQITAGP